MDKKKKKEEEKQNSVDIVTTERILCIKGSSAK